MYVNVYICICIFKVLYKKIGKFQPKNCFRISNNISNSLPSVDNIKYNTILQVYYINSSTINTEIT